MPSLAVTDHPVDYLEPLDLSGLSHGERQAALQALKWIVLTVDGKAIISKVLALRYLMHLESRSMEVVGEEYGICRATISVWVCAIGDALNLRAGQRSDAARANCAKAQRRIWKTRPKKNKQSGARRSEHHNTLDSAPSLTPLHS